MMIAECEAPDWTRKEWQKGGLSVNTGDGMYSGPESSYQRGLGQTLIKRQKHQHYNHRRNGKQNFLLMYIKINLLATCVF